jgi:DHA1 family tetracycline resistance protein-like MFS transporter
MKASKTASVQFIFITILLDALGLGILIPIMPDVIRRFGTSPDFVNQYFGYFISIYALMQFIASPVLGALSDRFGRRPVLLLSLVGAGADYVLMAFAPNLLILFLGRIISGLTGANFTVAGSYMADISDDSTRAKNFGLIGAGFGVGFILGPGIGGLLGGLSPQAPFLAAAALSLLNFAFGLFVLPESLPKESRRHVELLKLNPLKSIYQVAFKSNLMLLVWVYFLLYLGGQSHPSIWALYTEHKFNWTPTQVGISLSFVGVVMGVSQAWLTAKVVPRWGERKALFIGTAVGSVSFFFYAVATQGWMIYIIMLGGMLANVAVPALQSLISKDVPPQEQGELQGSLLAIASITGIIGPLLYTRLFSYFSAETKPFEFAGAPYVAAAIINTIALVLAYSQFRKNLTR